VRNKRIKVCIVSPLFNSLIGGPGRQAVVMARQLIKKGVAVTVIARRLSGMENEQSGIEVHYVPTLSPYVYNLSDFSLQNFIISVSFALGAMVRLFRLRKRYEVVQFYSASLPLLVCLPLLKVMRKKVVAKTTGGRGGKEAGGLDDFFLRPLLVAVFRYTDKFIAISKDILNRLLKEGFSEDKITNIPNGVDTEMFCPMLKMEAEALRKKFGFNEKKVFLYSGRLVEGKGLDLLVRAIKNVAKEYKNILLVFIGSGDYQEKIADMASSYGLEDFVKIEGTVDNVHEYLNASDIFVFPSFSEGMPNALLEAMACGLPVIASRIGGVFDVVEDGKSGILFEPGNVSGLASAILGLLKDDELRFRLGNEARKRIVDSFSIDRIADEYIRLYKEVLK
jgi:glycosyltransferase involved in cell wall biosynthesis